MEPSNQVMYSITKLHHDPSIISDGIKPTKEKVPCMEDISYRITKETLQEKKNDDTKYIMNIDKHKIIKEEYPCIEDIKYEHMLQEKKCEDMKHDIDIIEHKVEYSIYDSSFERVNSDYVELNTSSTRKESTPVSGQNSHPTLEGNYYELNKTNLNAQYNRHTGTEDDHNFSHSKMKNHRDEIHKIWLYECNECHERFPQLKECKSHIRVIHEGLDCYEHNECNKMCHTSAYKTYKDAHRIYKCTGDSRCHEKFSSIGELQAHNYEVHKEIRYYECNECQIKYTNKTILSAHMNYMHKIITYRCNECKKAFYEQNDLEVHTVTVHRPPRNKCFVCSKGFYFKSDIQIHLNKVHKANGKYFCEKCNKLFPRFREFQWHVTEVHNKVKEYKCSVCKKMFSASENLEKHISFVHKNINNK